MGLQIRKSPIYYIFGLFWNNLYCVSYPHKTIQFEELPRTSSLSRAMIRLVRIFSCSLLALSYTSPEDRTDADADTQNKYNPLNSYRYMCVTPWSDEIKIILSFALCIN